MTESDAERRRAVTEVKATGGDAGVVEAGGRHSHLDVPFTPRLRRKCPAQLHALGPVLEDLLDGRSATEEPPVRVDGRGLGGSEGRPSAADGRGGEDE
jgi:hypothetical protein